MKTSLSTMLGLVRAHGHAVLASSSSRSVCLLVAQAAAHNASIRPATGAEMCSSTSACNDQGHAGTVRMFSRSRSAAAEHALDEFMRLKRKHAKKQAQAGNANSSCSKGWQYQSRTSTWDDSNFKHKIIFEPLQTGHKHHRHASSHGHSNTWSTRQRQQHAQNQWDPPRQHRCHHSAHKKHHHQSMQQRQEAWAKGKGQARHARQHTQQKPWRQRRQRRTFSAAYGYDTRWWRRYWRMNEHDLDDEDESEWEDLHSSGSGRDADWEDWVDAYLRNLHPGSTSSRQSFRQAASDDRSWYDAQWGAHRDKSSRQQSNSHSSSQYRSNSSSSGSGWGSQQDEAGWTGYKQGSNWWERYHRAAGQAAGGATAGGWGSGTGSAFDWGGGFGGGGAAGAGRSGGSCHHPAHVIAHLAALGLSPTTQLQAPALKAAFHKCAMQWHPDRWANAAASTAAAAGSAAAAQQAAEKFKAAQAAYEALRTLC